MRRLDKEKRVYYTKNGVARLKGYLDEAGGMPLQTLWSDKAVQYVVSWGDENNGFDTQKSEGLLRRIIEASSRKGDLVADFFCGSGTTMAAAEKLERRWLASDLGRFAVHVSRKRLLDIPDCRPFQVLNLGRYERQHWQGAALGEGVQRYLDFIVELYRGEPVREHVHLHGRKAGRMIHVGATDAPVTLSEAKESLEECAANRYRGLDILGWEWEMGLHDIVSVEAARQAVDLRLLTIPREVMDKRAVEAGDIHFYELAYLDVEMRRQDGAFVASLRNFVIPNEELVPQEVREKIKRWSDYVDFWAVDWDFQGDTFHNQWQSYRTRKHTALRLESDPNTYEKPGKRQVMVKVIDIFGNDTTKLLTVNAT
jgi:hypothetical protein